MAYISGQRRMPSRQAFYRTQNSASRPVLRISYHPQASAMSHSASGATISSAGMAGLNPAFHFFPGRGRSRVFHQVAFPACQFLLLPIVNWYGFRLGGKVVPQVFDKLELLGGTQFQRLTLNSFVSPLQSSKLWKGKFACRSLTVAVR